MAQDAYQDARLMTVDDVAAYLGVSPRWLRQQVADGSLPARKIARNLRFRREEVDAFADKFRV
jgi:excisionase family DNA binding protein